MHSYEDCIRAVKLYKLGKRTAATRRKVLHREKRLGRATTEFLAHSGADGKYAAR